MILLFSFKVSGGAMSESSNQLRRHERLLRRSQSLLRRARKLQGRHADVHGRAELAKLVQNHRLCLLVHDSHRNPQGE